MVFISCFSNESNGKNKVTVKIEDELTPLKDIVQKEKVLQLDFPESSKELRFILNDDREL